MAVDIVLKCIQWFIILSMNFVTFSYSFDLGGASHSYSKFESWVPCHNGTITFEFQTRSGSGMLMYIDGGRKSNDYFELKLINGVLHLTFMLNNERNMLSAGQNLNNNEWHSVDLIRDGRLTTLKVDEFSYTRENQNYDPNYVTFENSNHNYVFIGGLPSEYSHKLSELAHPQIMFEPRLQGSVRNLFYSNCGKAMTSPQSLESEGLVMEGDKCMKNNPCKNDGICVMRDDGVQCDCSWTNFVGEYCEIGKGNNKKVMAVNPMATKERQPIEAMFQGAQYLTYDLTRRGDSFFSSNDELSMHFKTTQMSGLLFYTGEDNDYMTVSLKNGAIHVDINLGSGPYNKRVDMGGYKLDDGQWHEIVITRNSRQIDIKVDGTSRAVGSTMGEFTKLSSNILYVGGSPQPRDLLGSPVRTNFRGCMKKVEYKADSVSLQLIEMANRDDNLITVIGDVVFGKCEEVIDSQPVTYTTPGSFVALPRWDVKKNKGTISFQFQTTEADGLVMYNSGTYGSSNFDFFAMEIIDSYFYLIMDLGTGAIKEKVSRTEVDDGSPHIVYFKYSGRTGFIRVDAHETEYVTPGMGMQLDLEDMLFIGGLNFERYNSYRLPKELWSGILKHGFVGCIQDMEINDEKVDLMTVARKQLQRDIKSECQKIDAQCISQPCLHGGTCSEGWNRYACDCTNTSYKGRNCENAVATVSFSEAQYVLVTLPQESYTEAEDISLRFQTVRSSGLLLVTSSAISEDSIELYLERGACKLTISLGTGSKTLSVGHALNDDQWHTVYVKRRGQKLELRMDKSRPVEDIIPHIATTVRVKQMVLGSMGPLLSDFTVSSRSSHKLNSRSAGMQNDRSMRQHPWFVGAMQQFVYNGNHFFDMARDKDGEFIENIDVTARFDDGSIQVHNAVTFESQEAYVTLPHQLLKANSLHFSFNFKFKTQQRDGLILFSGLGPDFLAIELYQGFLYYIYDMGGGTKKILVNTPEALNDNKWHDVSLFRPQMDQQQIRVDDNPATVEDMKGYSARHFDLKGPLYIGGLVKSRFFSLSVKIFSRNGFLGCIASFDINGESISILEAATYVEQTSAHSVTSGCTGSELTCQATSCYNGGRCEQQWNSFKCNCDMTSFTGSHCADESVTYQFGLGKGLVVFEYPEDARPSTKTDYLALGITTIQTSQAKILRVDSADTDDYIEVELVNGNIFMVYNMGQENIPVVTLQQKVNDGKYHVIRFHRSGTDAVLEVDWERQDKNPLGQKMSVFNSQARIMIGGRKMSQGDVTRAFQGTVSGVVFNGIRVLDLLKEGDPRVAAEGNVSLVQPTQSILPPVPVKTPATDIQKGVQSTQGVKNEIFKRSISKENSARRSQKTSNKRSSRFYLQRKNMIDQQQEFDEQLASHENMIIKEKQRQFSRNHQNVAKNHARKSHHKAKHVKKRPSGPSYVTKNVIGGSKKDHVIGGNVHSAKEVGSVENDDTDVEYSGYSMIDTETFPTDDDSLKKRTKGDYWKESAINKFITMTLFLPADHRVSGKEAQGKLKVHVGKSRTEPFARDSRRTFYPKDRGKPGTAYRRRGYPDFTQHSNKKHSKSTTPKQRVTDEIIYSGEGPDCYSDDEDECIQTTSGSDDDIIKPTIVITRVPTPKPEPENQGNYTCKDTDCKPQGTELAPSKNTTGYNPHTTNPDGKTTDLNEPRAKKSSGDSGHLNIFLIVGIACGVLVALMILLVALYKFRSRDEGSYRVDESQNFAYLEAKKQQANGAAATNIGNGKAGGKKKDVKEWYV